MARDTLTGSRIRERRISMGMKQSQLAQAVDISGSYLNLIEHNRRRIGGKLLVSIARTLEVEPTTLSEGAGAALVATLREAASGMAAVPAEIDRIDEFAGRFPGWAQLLAKSQERVATLEATINTLNDRLTHDPHLAASLHEVLTAVTSIRSTASILAEPGSVDPEWQARFHRNIYEDSARLAATSRSLVSYLDKSGEQASDIGTPEEELDAVLSELGHRCEVLENGGSVEAVLEGQSQTLSPAAAELFQGWLRRYAADAGVLPADRLLKALEKLGPDPVRLSATLNVAPDLVMRRLAALPETELDRPIGLVICDASGVLVFRKPIQAFAVPKFGAACPMWPLYRALTRPMMVLSGVAEQPRDDRRPLVYYATTAMQGTAKANAEPIFHGYMMVHETSGADVPLDKPVEIGLTCRVCPRDTCHARREPSILSRLG